MTGRARKPEIDPVRHHKDWLALVEVTGPFLSLPVLREHWPTLDSLAGDEREQLRRAHARWQAESGRDEWIEYLLRDLLEWDSALYFPRGDSQILRDLAVEKPEHDATLVPDFLLVDPAAPTRGTDGAGLEDGPAIKPSEVRLLGMVCPPGAHPTARISDSTWAATPVDRLAQLCRYHGVELGLVTDGRWWVLVWAPKGGVTSHVVFDAVGWAEAADRDVVRAFRSFLRRSRFFSVPENQQLPALLKASEDSQEDLTDALGVQVRQAVELLVTAIGRADVKDRADGKRGIGNVTAHEVYRGAVSVMMRVVFLLFAEERKLLPSDNELYAQAYSAARLGAELQQRAQEGSEDELENSTAAWHRLLALFTAVHDGVEHPRLSMTAHDGSLFDPDAYLWMPKSIDDRTVLHMLRAVQYVDVGRGKNRERRTLSFRQLDVEQIGYVYEGLLSYEGFRASEVVVGLIGKPGLEEEVPLSELEKIPAAELAARLAEKYKSSGIGTVKALEKALAPIGPGEREEVRKKYLAVTDRDYELAERLLPFHGIIRTDLRDLPVVILESALYVTESQLRKNTGTHYTPRKLAEEVVEHALEPLLYHVGPLQTADKTRWTHKSAAEILELKVADIAMGSAAFLVAAARYLGQALVSAWGREGTVVLSPQDETAPRDADEDPTVVEARRQIIEHCLYGVDINPMAVEMAKLSLWLVSMDAKRPFTFLDDRLIAGDSLLGVTSVEQIEYLHLDPKKARELRKDMLPFMDDVQSIVAAAAEARRRINEIDMGQDPIAALEQKRALLEEALMQTSRLERFADLTVGHALAGARKTSPGKPPVLSKEALYEQAVTLAQHVAEGEEFAARQVAIEWLETEQPAEAVAAGLRRDPMHWPLRFPEAFQGGGFDAVIGNPPFLGGKKISGSHGSAYREYLVASVGDGVKGNADLVAYFALRSHAIVNEFGQVGIIATNTLAQGDTREVGLDRIAASASIRRAIKSSPWPSRSAALEFCAVWTSAQAVARGVSVWVDGAEVEKINSLLEPGRRADGHPVRLHSNFGSSYIGSYALGSGFLMTEADSKRMLSGDRKNAEVIKPFLNGDDLNSTPDMAATRWIVDFGQRREELAREWVEPWAWLEQHLKPERLQKDPVKYPAMVEQWWQFWRPRRELYSKIEGFDRVVAIALVSKIVMPAFVSTGQVFSHMLGVFVSSDPAMLSLLSGSSHYWWAASRASTLETRIRYTPSDVFETFPLCELTHEMRDLGDGLDTYRRDVMLARQTGLTKTYNLVFDPTVHDEDIQELRRIHKVIDEATVRAYGWDDLLDKLDHGFHPAGRDLRYTIGPAAQREILDRLLELNHERYAEEVAQGLHDKKKGAKKPKVQQQDKPEGLF